MEWMSFAGNNHAMETIPVYIPLAFILTVLVTFFFLGRATHFARPIMIALVAWLLLQALLTRSGFYSDTAGVPPRFVLLLLPPLIFSVLFFLLSKGRGLAARLDTKTLTLMHIVRVPVEIVLYLLMLQKVVPSIMTFEGRNFDILCGITAPFVYYFGYVKKVLGRKGLIAWNIACLLLLGNIVITAVLSAPFRFQQFAFDQPNIAILYFPYCWLACFVVPAAFFAHLAALRQLAVSK